MWLVLLVFSIAAAIASGILWMKSKPGKALNIALILLVIGCAIGSFPSSVSASSSLTITTTSLPAGTVGVAYSVSLAASGGQTKPPYSWSLAKEDRLPPGLRLSSAGVISGTPTLARPYAYDFSIGVADSTRHHLHGIPVQKAAKRLSITIKPPAVAPLSITTTSLPAGTVKVAYSASLAAIGGKTPYSWSIISGSLPLGLSISSAGVISGTPTSAGTFNFTIIVRDSSSPAQTAQKPLSIRVEKP